MQGDVFLRLPGTNRSRARPSPARIASVHLFNACEFPRTLRQQIPRGRQNQTVQLWRLVELVHVGLYVPGTFQAVATWCEAGCAHLVRIALERGRRQHVGRVRHRPGGRVNRVYVGVCEGERHRKRECVCGFEREGERDGRAIHHGRWLR
jgi:hypothetical protein